MPLPLAQPEQRDQNRNQSKGHEAPETKAVGLTVRLTGFEKQKHNHRGVSYLVREGPLRCVPSRNRPVVWGILTFECSCSPTTLHAFPLRPRCGKPQVTLQEQLSRLEH